MEITALTASCILLSSTYTVECNYASSTSYRHNRSEMEMDPPWLPRNFFSIVVAGRIDKQSNTWTTIVYSMGIFYIVELPEE